MFYNPTLPRLRTKLTRKSSLDLCKILQPNKGRLTSLNIRDITSLEYKDLVELITFGYLDNVTELRMTALPVDDGVAELLASQSNALRTLDVGHTRITG